MRDFNRFEKRSFGGGFGGRREGGRDARPQMHDAVCAECGRDCQVPFKPNGSKDVFCSDCFDKRDDNFNRDDRRSGGRDFNRFDESYGNRPGRGSSNFERRDRDSRDNEMFSAVCDECGKNCKLPFRPSSNKPVYCSDCFEMRGERSGARENSNASKGNTDTAKEVRELKDQFISMNVKLEKIMKALNIQAEKPREPKVVKVSTSDFTAAVTEEVPVVVADDTAIELSEVPAKKAVKKTAKKAVKKTVKKAAKKAE